MKYTPLTDKAKRLRAWLKHNLDKLAELQLIDDEIFRIERAHDHAPEEKDTLLAAAHDKRTAIEAEVKQYRATLAAMTKAVDLSGYRPITEANLRRYIYLRYYRGFPVEGKHRAATIMKETGLSRPMLVVLNTIALNRLADVWEE